MAVVDGDSNMESASEASSSCTPSIYTYDSARDAAQFLKEHDGRSFNNLNDTYYLPAGEFFALILLFQTCSLIFGHRRG